MKYPSPSHAAQLSRAATGTVLALAASGLAAASPVPQIVTAEIVSLPGPAAGVEFFTNMTGDSSGSWVANASALTGPAAGESVFFGVLSGSGTSTPSILRIPQQLSGFTQEGIFWPEVQGDRIAYTSYSPPADPGFTAWIDDTVVAAEGIPIGTTGLEWFGASTPILADGQAFYVRGLAQPVGGTSVTGVVVRYPSEQVVLETGMMIPGLGGPITGIESFDPNSAGTVWAAVVQFESSNTGQTEQAILLNGVVATLPFQQRINTEVSDFVSIGSISLRDNFDLIFDAVDSAGRVIYRNGRPAYRGDFSQMVAVDDDNRFITFANNPGGTGLSFEGISLDRPGASAVDADGDGDADPGWGILSSGGTMGGAAPLDVGGLLTVASVQAPGVGTVRAVVRARLMLPDVVVCEGEPNSLGVRAQLRAVGSDVPTIGNLQMRVTDRQGGVLLPLVSRTQGFVANPAGSAGNLCLAGSIGRGVPVNGAGSLTFSMFPQAFPQPNGFEAALSGETWYFQAWYRDFQGGQPANNFTSAVAVTFR